VQEGEKKKERVNKQEGRQGKRRNWVRRESRRGEKKERGVDYERQWQWVVVVEIRR
jgi:hypothetical protein